MKYKQIEEPSGNSVKKIDIEQSVIELEEKLNLILQYLKPNMEIVKK